MMAFSIDIVLVGAGLLALACVMLFLSSPPGRKQRAKLRGLLFSSTRQALPKHCVFISYRHADSADVVGRLYEHLITGLGSHTVFKDVYGIRHGRDFRAQLDASLNACLVFVCVMGDEWAGPTGAPDRRIDNPEDYVRIEVETALRRNIPLIPVFVGGMRTPSADFFPDSLKGLAFMQGLPLRPDPDFQKDTTELISSITSHLEDHEMQRQRTEIATTGSQRSGG
jgi:TIR domain